jgi:hypothetical protein
MSGETVCYHFTHTVCNSLVGSCADLFFEQGLSSFPLSDILMFVLEQLSGKTLTIHPIYYCFWKKCCLENMSY